MDDFCYVCGAEDNGSPNDPLNWCCERDKTVVCQSCYHEATQANKRQAQTLKQMFELSKCPGNWKPSHSVEDMVKGLQMIVADL